MKKVFSKIISVVICSIIVLSLFACNSGDKAKKGTLKISYWNSGWGDSWLYELGKAFEKKYPEYSVSIDSASSEGAITQYLPVPDSHSYDMILGCNTEPSYYEEYYEPLNDVLEVVNEGETKTVAQKIGTSLLSALKFTDGTVRNLFFGAGYYGLIYNQDIFDEFNYQVPKTTNEMLTLISEMKHDNVVPFINFVNGGYWHAMLWTWAMQYAGYKDFYKLTENPKLADLTDDENGIKQALEVLSSLLNDKDNYLDGSNAYSFTIAQTKFLAPSKVTKKKIAMMVNGSWLENEMQNSEDQLNKNMKYMKTPILSSIINKCSTINDEAKLIEVIDAVDDGKTSVSGVSDDDFTTIQKARLVEVTNATALEICVPNYALNVDIAKKFIAFFYSDEGLRIWIKNTGVKSLVNFDDENTKIDENKLSVFCKSQLDFANRSMAVLEGQTKSVHRIFTDGNASLTAGYILPAYVTAMMGENALSGSKIWENVKSTIEKNWSSYWRNCGLVVPEE